MVRNNPPVVMAIQKNILEHISIMAQEQVQVEFIQELQQLPMLQQQAQMNPQAAQQIQRITIQIESRKAQLIAEMTKDYADEENKIVGQYDSDPLLKLKSREVDLKAIENEQKRKEAEDRINLDKLKALLNQNNEENKLEQNAELAKLRASVSLAKQNKQRTN
jgi:signal transduction histidine kinase